MEFILGTPQKDVTYINTAFLRHDGWNDWFKYETLYHLTVFDHEGKSNYIGEVKIAETGQAISVPQLPPLFTSLEENFFSLGQNENYYETLETLENNLGELILESLKDCAINLERFERHYQNEYIMRQSLLRYIDRETVTHTFHSIISNNRKLMNYHFSYKFPNQNSENLQLDFSVVPKSKPPTNIQVIIGRNGVGKTRLFRQITLSLKYQGKEDVYGSFNFHSDVGSTKISNLISVSFSAFDPFEPLPNGQLGNLDIKYNYVGLQKPNLEDSKHRLPPKSHEELTQEFLDSLNVCMTKPRYIRWKEAINLLHSDPLFKQANIIDLIDEEKIDTCEKTFKRLSSGHQIVLLTITKLVELVDEKTLVLLDEPEGHLHPPLFSSFVRSLSYLLSERNGAAIIASHSPVILQEVPKDCTWILNRSGSSVNAKRPDIETFGENVGVLTREVFGLEVTHSGFHQLLEKEIQNSTSYEEILNNFNGKLGNEAKSIIQSLIYYKLQEDSDD